MRPIGQSGRVEPSLPSVRPTGMGRLAYVGAALAVAAAFACTADDDPAAEAPPPERGEIVVEPEAAAPGEEVLLRFPTEMERGVPFYLSRWNEDSWEEPSFLLISDGGGAYDCVVCPTYFELGQDWGWEDIAIQGPGPDRIVVPDTAVPGTYRACTANTGDQMYCAQFTVTEHS